MRNRTARSLRSRNVRRRTAARRRKARPAIVSSETRVTPGSAPNGLCHRACDLLL